MALIEFQPKFLEEILQDMINYVLVEAPELTDYNIGSRIRTILEACATEDDEQYHQMVNLSLLWNLDNLRGVDLEERLLEWNVSRLPAVAASSKSNIISNNNLISSFLTSPSSVGDTSSILLASAGFSATSFPYNIRVGEGTVNVEDVAVSGNNPSSRILTHGALVNDHAAGERVSLVDGSNATISIGTRIRVPGTSIAPELTATITEEATIIAGNYDSNPVAAVMDAPGIYGNVSSRSVSEFVGGAPFDGAVVRNEGAYAGGRNVESDDQLRSRGRKKIQALARGTKLSLEQLVVGLSYVGLDGQTWRVLSARAQESFTNSCNDQVRLYIWAGAFGFITSATVSTPEVLTASAEDGQTFFRLAHTAIKPNSLVLQKYPSGGTGYATITQGVDYYINEGTGQIEIASPGLNAGDKIQALTYIHYTGLLNQVQVAVNGATRNPIAFPGISSAGVKVLVSFPRPKTIDPVRISIQAKPGYSEADLAPLVANAVAQYFAELQTGEDLIRAELIQRGMDVEGMHNLQLDSPTSDIVFLEDEVLDPDTVSIIIS